MLLLTSGEWLIQPFVARLVFNFYYFLSYLLYNLLFLYMREFLSELQCLQLPSCFFWWRSHQICVNTIKCKAVKSSVCYKYTKYLPELEIWAAPAETFDRIQHQPCSLPAQQILTLLGLHLTGQLEQQTCKTKCIYQTTSTHWTQETLLRWPWSWNEVFSSSSSMKHSSATLKRLWRCDGCEVEIFHCLCHKTPWVTLESDLLT